SLTGRRGGRIGLYQPTERLHMGRLLMRANRENMLQRRSFGTDSLHHRQELVLHNDRHRIAIAELIDKFALFVRGINRANDSPNADDSKPAHQKFWAVLHEQAYALSLAQT